MKCAAANMENGQVSEMAIVDTFTKLIFGEDSQYSNRELKIIQAFRAVDQNVVFDSHREMGEYLRALGVGEMIELVAQVQARLCPDLPIVGRCGAPASPPVGALERRLH